MPTRRILAAALIVVIAATPVTTIQEVEFSTALLVGGEIEFDAPESIDWQSLAPKEWTNFELSRVTPEFLTMLREKQNMFNDAEMVFDAPLPVMLSSRHFYFVSENGIRELRGDRLKGTLRFSLGRNDALVARLAYGRVVGIPTDEESLDPGGFVMTFDAAVPYEIDESARQDVEFAPEDVRTDWNALSEIERGFWTVQTKYLFRFQGGAASYVFVHWAPDRECQEGCCGLRYSVFTDEDPPVRVGSLSAQCDI